MKCYGIRIQIFNGGKVVYNKTYKDVFIQHNQVINKEAYTLLQFPIENTIIEYMWED